MTVKIKNIDGNIETFETENYLIGSKKEMHPAILDVKVYTGGRLIVHRRRHFQKFYKKYLYKPVQQELQPENAEPELTEK